MMMQVVPRITYSLKIAQVFFITGVLTSTTLAGATPKALEMLTPEQATMARDQIINWLECVDCTDHELERVAQLGLTAVPSLIATLRQGPSDAQREIMRRRLITLFAQSIHSGERKPDNKMTMSESAYVEHHLKGYSNRYRIRAAIALGRIGGPESKTALKGALDEGSPPSVRAVVKNVFNKMQSPTAMPE